MKEVKIPSRMQNTGKIYLPWFDEMMSLKEGEPICIPTRAFDKLIYPLKKAVHDKGLRIVDGRIQGHSNSACCPVLFFPEQVEVMFFDMPPNTPAWYNTLAISAYYDESEKGYIVEKSDFLKYATNKDLIDFCYGDEVPLSLLREKLDDVLNAYLDNLLYINVASYNTKLEFLGWMAPGRSEEPVAYYWIDNTSLKKHLEDDITYINDKDIPSLRHEVDGLFFAITLFSLCKPLFSWCKVRTNAKFSVQLLIAQASLKSELEFARAHRAIDCLLDFWCNYREWLVRSKSMLLEGTVKSKFRRHWDKVGVLAKWDHLNFPLLFTNYKRISWDLRRDSDVNFYPGTERALKKKQLTIINQASCLPILLPYHESERTQKRLECLTLSLRIPDIEKELHRFSEGQKNELGLNAAHKNLIRYYLSIMKGLSSRCINEYKGILRKCYKSALLDLGALQKSTPIEYQYKACLLGTLYFVKEIQPKEVATTRLDRAIQYLKIMLGHYEKAPRVEDSVKVSDFAEFVRQSLKEDSEYHNILFHQDEGGIYFYYNQYWAAFQRFCKSNDLDLFSSAAHFRREVLYIEKLIKPQYEVPPGSGKYPRFDYVKKIGDCKERVLNVSPKILSL